MTLTALVITRAHCGCYLPPCCCVAFPGWAYARQSPALVYYPVHRSASWSKFILWPDSGMAIGQINKEQVIPLCEHFPGTLGRKILYPISTENWTREKPHLGERKEKLKMAYPFLASIASYFESKIIYNFSQNINIEYCYSSFKIILYSYNQNGRNKLLLMKDITNNH